MYKIKNVLRKEISEFKSPHQEGFLVLSNYLDQNIFIKDVGKIFVEDKLLRIIEKIIPRRTISEVPQLKKLESKLQELPDSFVPSDVANKISKLEKKSSDGASDILNSMIDFAQVSSEYFKKLSANISLRTEEIDDIGAEYSKLLDKGERPDIDEIIKRCIDTKDAKTSLTKKVGADTIFFRTRSKEMTSIYKKWHEKGFWGVLKEELRLVNGGVNKENSKSLVAQINSHTTYMKESKTNIDESLAEQVFEELNSKESRKIKLGQIGEKFNAHGMVRGNRGEILEQLDSLLSKGIDKNRTFYTAPLDLGDEARGASFAMGTATNGAYKHGHFVLVAEKDKSICEDGIKYVVANKSMYADIEELQRKYPQVEFIKMEKVNELFSKL